MDDSFFVSHLWRSIPIYFSLTALTDRPFKCRAFGPLAIAPAFFRSFMPLALLCPPFLLWIVAQKSHECVWLSKAHNGLTTLFLWLVVRERAEGPTLKRAAREGCHSRHIHHTSAVGATRDSFRPPQYPDNPTGRRPCHACDMRQIHVWCLVGRRVTLLNHPCKRTKLRL